jgi:hypothetical protein
MPAIIPQVLFDLESEMMAIVEDEFHRVNASENSWWREVTRVRTTKKKRDIVTWLLSTAQIYDSGKTGGDIIFDDMAATLTEYDVRNAAARRQRRQRLRLCNRVVVADRRPNRVSTARARLKADHRGHDRKLEGVRRRAILRG